MLVRCQTDPRMSVDALHKTLADLDRSIELCLRSKLPMSSLILLYTTIDVERTVDLMITDLNPFVYDNVAVRETEDQKIVALGEVTNNTEESLASATFHIKLFDEVGAVVAETDFQVENLGIGQTVPFEVEIDHEYTKISNFQIDHVPPAE